jgi:hypothetical protein
MRLVVPAVVRTYPAAGTTLHVEGWGIGWQKTDRA